MTKALPRAVARLVCCAALLCGWVDALPARAQDNTLWPAFRHDNQRTGRSPLAGPSFPDALWQRDLRGFAYASPAFGPGGIVYVASERTLFAFDRGGLLEWTFDFRESVQATVDIRGIVSSPAVTSAGTVYIGSLDENLYCLDPNGVEVWHRDTDGQIFSSPAVDAAGRVFVGSRSGGMYAFNANGTTAWGPFLTAGEVFASPALDPDGSLYFGSTDGALYALNSATGALKWAPFNAGSEFVSSPAIAADGTVYAGSLNDLLYAIDGDTGRPLWAFNTGGDIVSSPAIGADGTVYVATLDGALHAINPTNGQARWGEPFQASERIASSPAIGQDGLIYFGALDGTFYAIEDTGNAPAIRWTYAAGSPVWSSPAIATGETLYFVSSGLNNDRGLLHAVGPSAFDLRFQDIPTAGQDALLTILQAGSGTPASGSIFYRRAGDPTFSSQTFAGQTTIPGAALTERGLEYYIVDDEGAVYPTNNAQQRPASQIVRVTNATPPYTLLPRVYKMIASPLVLDDPSLDNTLGDDYGAYDPLHWRLLRWKGDDYVEFPALDDPVGPGEAFFLVTRDGTTFDAGPGFSVGTSLPFPIVLQPGWNMIANPFAFPVAWASVDRDPAIVNAIAYFDGTEMIQDPAAIEALAPWEGYFIFNASDAPVTIAIPPDAAPSTPSEPTDAPLARLVASVPGLEGRDSQNWIGFGPVAAVREAPALDAPVQLTISEDETPLAVSRKPMSEGPTFWALRLSAPTDAGRARLRLEGAESAFAGQDIYLIDDDLGFARPVAGDDLEVPLLSGRSERRLRLAVGPAGTLDRTLADFPIAPVRTTLLPNYPNPFRGATTIAYELAEPGPVSLTIYNSLGQVVRTLVDAWQSPGRYAVDWSAEAGPVASGLYVYRLTAGSFSATGTMTRVR
jgi:outer membrane protein assembly factor BamB